MPVHRPCTPPAPQRREIRRVDPDRVDAHVSGADRAIGPLGTGTVRDAPIVASIVVTVAATTRTATGSSVDRSSRAARARPRNPNTERRRAAARAAAQIAHG